MDFPNVKPIAMKALVNVLHCHIHWQPQGQFFGRENRSTEKCEVPDIYLI